MNKDTGKRTKIKRDGDREREESNNLMHHSHSSLDHRIQAIRRRTDELLIPRYTESYEHSAYLSLSNRSFSS